MRVVCLVPSWTETLIEAGVSVVGRTQFCVHPRKSVGAIPTVGGTKKAQWEKIKALNPDLVILDKEENTKEMAEECPIPWMATHVLSMKDMPRELNKLAEKLQNEKLRELARRWERVLASSGPKMNLLGPPGLVKWVTIPPTVVGEVVYVIWANPWMAVGPNTFIGSVMAWCGWELWGDEKYPKFDPARFGKDTVYLCSTEPYPFAKRPDITGQLAGTVAVVDGERISWFGVRCLMYLESLLNI